MAALELEPSEALVSLPAPLVFVSSIVNIAVSQLKTPTIKKPLRAIVQNVRAILQRSIVRWIDMFSSEEKEVWVEVYAAYVAGRRYAWNDSERQSLGETQASIAANNAVASFKKAFPEKKECGYRENAYPDANEFRPGHEVNPIYLPPELFGTPHK